MPELSRFYGISILMYFNDHPPPHFHVVYDEHRAVISVQDLRMTEGALPRRFVALVLEWPMQHRQALQDAWDRLATSGERTRIPPLE